jgi:hypothetical protein
MVTAVSNGAVVYRRDAVQQQQQLLLLSPYTASRPRFSFHLNLSFRPIRNARLKFPCSIGAVVETPRRLYRKILDARTATGDKSQDDMLIGDGRSLRRNMSAAMSALVSPRVTFAPAAPAKCREVESPKMAAGWPLLKKDTMPALLESSEVSVVQWAMQLPTRCSDNVSDERECEKQLPEELVALREKYSSKYTMFSYRELAKITNGFSPGMSLHFNAENLSHLQSFYRW